MYFHIGGYVTSPVTVKINKVGKLLQTSDVSKENRKGGGGVGLRGGGKRSANEGEERRGEECKWGRGK